jgi:hypothetical protein
VALPCDHPRLVRLDVDDDGVPLYGRIYMCETCELLVEVVTGRSFSTEDVQKLADQLSSGAVVPSDETHDEDPDATPIDASDLIEVNDVEDSWRDE